jgi:uncharacterized protein YdiU (UPF0061 family)
MGNTIINPLYGYIFILHLNNIMLHFKYLKENESKYSEVKQAKYERVFEEIVKKTATLVADWQCFGFVHGYTFFFKCDIWIFF